MDFERWSNVIKENRFVRGGHNSIKLKCIGKRTEQNNNFILFQIQYQMMYVWCQLVMVMLLLLLYDDIVANKKMKLTTINVIIQ